MNIRDVIRPAFGDRYDMFGGQPRCFPAAYADMTILRTQIMPLFWGIFPTATPHYRTATMGQFMAPDAFSQKIYSIALAALFFVRPCPLQMHFTNSRIISPLIFQPFRLVFAAFWAVMIATIAIFAHPLQYLITIRPIVVMIPPCGQKAYFAFLAVAIWGVLAGVEVSKGFSLAALIAAFAWYTGHVSLLQRLTVPRAFAAPRGFLLLSL